MIFFNVFFTVFSLYIQFYIIYVLYRMLRGYSIYFVFLLCYVVIVYIPFSSVHTCTEWVNEWMSVWICEFECSCMARAASAHIQELWHGRSWGCIVLEPATLLVPVNHAHSHSLFTHLNWWEWQPILQLPQDDIWINTSAARLSSDTSQC